MIDNPDMFRVTKSRRALTKKKARDNGRERMSGIAELWQLELFGMGKC